MMCLLSLDGGAQSMKIFLGLASVCLDGWNQCSAHILLLDHRVWYDCLTLRADCLSVLKGNIGATGVLHLHFGICTFANASISELVCLLRTGALIRPQAKTKMQQWQQLLWLCILASSVQMNPAHAHRAPSLNQAHPRPTAHLLHALCAPDSVRTPILDPLHISAHTSYPLTHSTYRSPTLSAHTPYLSAHPPYHLLYPLSHPVRCISWCSSWSTATTEIRTTRDAK